MKRANCIYLHELCTTDVIHLLRAGERESHQPKWIKQIVRLYLKELVKARQISRTEIDIKQQNVSEANNMGFNENNLVSDYMKFSRVFLPSILRLLIRLVYNFTLSVQMPITEWKKHAKMKWAIFAE